MKRRLAALPLCVFVVVCVAAACGGEPEERAREGQRAQPIRGETTRQGRTEEGPRQRQQATYYGEELSGSPTASGEPYDPGGLTAAHKTLPLGAVLEVCYRGCARVRINDRNHSSEADLDLSRAAADRIGLTPHGVGTVETEVVE